jgi:hypothetical protein
MGSLMGSLAVAVHGTQGLTLTLEQFRARFARAFGSELP